MSQPISTTGTTVQPGLIKAILITGFVAGTLDGASPIVVYGLEPVKLFQYIASAALGREMAYGGGLATAFLGLLFHYIIAYSWTVLFFLLYPKIDFLGKNRIVSGIIYGIVVWAVMNIIVVPLTKIPGRPFNPVGAMQQAAILIVCIGLPISFLAHKYYSKK